MATSKISLGSRKVLNIKDLHGLKINQKSSCDSSFQLRVSNHFTHAYFSNTGKVLFGPQGNILLQHKWLPGKLIHIHV